MTITFHDALGAPADRHPGPELDCPKCRTALLEAFRAPVLPVAPVQARTAPEPSPELPVCPFCGQGRSDLNQHIHLMHKEQHAAWSAHPATEAGPEHRTQPVRSYVRCAYCGHPVAERSCAFCSDIPLDQPDHITEHGIDPDPDQPGGDWFARCTCGWSEKGHYARDGQAAEQTAGRLAKIKAQKHRNDEAKEADQ